MDAFQHKTFRIAPLLLAVLAFTAAFAIAFAPGSAQAVTSAERQADADQVAVNIDALQTQLNVLYDDYNDAIERRDEAREAADEAAARVQAANERIAWLQSALGSRVKDMYKTGGNAGFLDVVLGSTSFEEFVTAWDAANTIAAADAAMVSEAKDLREEAEEQQALFEEKSALADEEADRALAAAEEIESAKAVLEEELATINEEVAMLQAKEEEERIAAEEARKREEAARAAAAAALTGGFFYEGSEADRTYEDTSGTASEIAGWVNPLPSYYGVTNPFGWAGAWDGVYHNGIDLGASTGAPIYAAGPGTVTYVGWYGSGGQAVIISHGNGVRTIYMHMSGYACTQGQQVTAGTLIGYVGMTGYTTGPHLHFQIEINGTPTDPRAYYNF